ncbi:MAG: Fic family protein [Bacteroidales bacterium]|nr:Fic family protein [Bacteroidales bacterium]
MDNIIELYKKWRSLQPIKEEDRMRLERKFMLEFNYNSNHLEGNTLTYGQTEFLLLFGRAVDGADMRDLEEMKASNVCLQMVKEEAADKDHHLTEYFIRTLHKTLLREDYVVKVNSSEGVVSSYTVHAGIYKTRPNSVKTKTGELFTYASPEETPALMADLLQWYNDAEFNGELSPIELAALFHYRYIRIHPFEDGNGRIARLIVNYILIKNGYPMLIVKSSDKDNYLQALNACDLVVGLIPSEGAHADITEINPFLEYLKKCLIQSLNISIKAAKGESIEEPDDFDKELVLIEKNVRKTEAIEGDDTIIQHKLDVFNNFHRLLSERLSEALKPVYQFFNSIHTSYYISLKGDTIDLKGFITVNSNKPLTRKLVGNKLNIIKNAKSILFWLSFESVKDIYNMKDISITVKADVLFDLHGYSFNGVSYSYGKYPDMDVINSFISETKASILKKIKAAATKE